MSDASGNIHINVVGYTLRIGAPHAWHWCYGAFCAAWSLATCHLIWTLVPGFFRPSTPSRFPPRLFLLSRDVTLARPARAVQSNSTSLGKCLLRFLSVAWLAIPFVTTSRFFSSKKSSAVETRTSLGPRPCWLIDCWRRWEWFNFSLIINTHHILLGSRVKKSDLKKKSR